MLADINFRSMAIGDIVIAVIVVAAIIAIAIVVLRVYEIKIPPWLVNIFWIVVAAFVAIFAIRILLNM